MKFNHAVVKQYVKVVDKFRAAESLVALQKWKSLNVEKLRGRKPETFSARINRQYRLEFTFQKETVTIRCLKISKHYE